VNAEFSGMASKHKGLFTAAQIVHGKQAPETWRIAPHGMCKAEAEDSPGDWKRGGGLGINRPQISL
jgi:hypothetical protein